MTMFYCKLLYKGYIMDSFYRNGEDEKSLLKDLKSFQHPKGEWVVKEVRDGEEDDNNEDDNNKIDDNIKFWCQGMIVASEDDN